GSDEEMKRLNARRIVAMVTNLQAVGYRPVRCFVSSTMRGDGLAVHALRNVVRSMRKRLARNLSPISHYDPFSFAVAAFAAACASIMASSLRRRTEGCGRPCSTVN